MNFEEFLTSLACPPHELVFVGLGNPARSDDAAGLALLSELSLRPELAGARFIVAGTNPENYLAEMLEASPKKVIFIDAVESDDPPGEMQWLDSGQVDGAAISTHAFSIRLIEKYLKAHKPLEVLYFGIRPASVRVGCVLSSVVQESLRRFFAHEPEE